jgi:hypothetical protein
MKTNQKYDFNRLIHRFNLDFELILYKIHL